jgi:hypothetical protein
MKYESHPAIQYRSVVAHILRVRIRLPYLAPSIISATVCTPSRWSPTSTLPNMPELPGTMKAIKVVGTGKAEVQNVPLPKMRDDYILVKVHAVALNPTDW